jgi:hypothetical protein
MRTRDASIKVVRCTNKTEMRESLREISELQSFLVSLLREQSHVIGEREHLFEQQSCICYAIFVQFTATSQCFDQPKGANIERALDINRIRRVKD